MDGDARARAGVQGHGDCRGDRGGKRQFPLPRRQCLDRAAAGEPAGARCDPRRERHGQRGGRARRLQPAGCCGRAGADPPVIDRAARRTYRRNRARRGADHGRKGGAGGLCPPRRHAPFGDCRGRDHGHLQHDHPLYRARIARHAGRRAPCREQSADAVHQCPAAQCPRVEGHGRAADFRAVRLSHYGDDRAGDQHRCLCRPCRDRRSGGGQDDPQSQCAGPAAQGPEPRRPRRHAGHPLRGERARGQEPASGDVRPRRV